MAEDYIFMSFYPGSWRFQWQIKHLRAVVIFYPRLLKCYFNEYLKDENISQYRGSKCDKMWSVAFLSGFTILLAKYSTKLSFIGKLIRNLGNLLFKVVLPKWKTKARLKPVLVLVLVYLYWSIIILYKVFVII